MAKKSVIAELFFINLDTPESSSVSLYAFFPSNAENHSSGIMFLFKRKFSKALCVHSSGESTYPTEGRIYTT